MQLAVFFPPVATVAHENPIGRTQTPTLCRFPPSVGYLVARLSLPAATDAAQPMTDSLCGCYLGSRTKRRLPLFFPPPQSADFSELRSVFIVLAKLNFFGVITEKRHTAAQPRCWAYFFFPCLAHFYFSRTYRPARVFLSLMFANQSEVVFGRGSAGNSCKCPVCTIWYLYTCTCSTQCRPSSCSCNLG